MNLYVHFPFCRSKCAYCALLSRVGTTRQARNAYVNRIVSEIPNDVEFGTVYFGGGTPLMCDLKPIFEKLKLASDYEFTVEMHPLDVNDENLSLLLAGGVNRISLGVQSFDNEALKSMRRGCNADESAAAFLKAREYFPNCGIDLIAGWPGVDNASWHQTLGRAIELSPVHISCYALIREPMTQLDLAIKKGKVILGDEAHALAQIDMASEMFAKAGLNRYEVSNYARVGFECRHNMAVWKGEDYFGIGEGAHGRRELTRTRGLASGYETSVVSAEEDAFERSVLGLRTARGINLAQIAEKFPILSDRMSGWENTLEMLVSEGILLSRARGVYVPTHRGFEVCDAVMCEL